jgi:hypothetical protein
VPLEKDIASFFKKQHLFMQEMHIQLFDRLPPTLTVVLYSIPAAAEVAVLQDVVDAAFDIRDEVEALRVERRICVLLEDLTPELDLISVYRVHSQDRKDHNDGI